MTAEIAIMNKNGVALAADSAVTVTGPQGQKIYNTANKLFQLSKFAPVGVMIYGNGDFMNVPWELIIKVYRVHLGDKSFGTIDEYASDFLEFLRNADQLVSPLQEEAFYRGMLTGFFQMLVGSIHERINNRSDEGQGTTEDDLQAIVTSVIQEHHVALKEAKAIPGATATAATKVTRKYSPLIDEAVSQIFEDLPVSGQDKKSLRAIAKLLCWKDIYPDNTSGVVFAGYGDDQLFPAISAYKINGILGSILRGQCQESIQIALDSPSLIMPLAQREMVESFMEGIDARYRYEIERTIADALGEFSEQVLRSLSPALEVEERERVAKQFDAFSEELHQRCMSNLREHSEVNHIVPVIEAVNVLPKDELAVMAETLVNLTSFKRKMSLGLETVGGPIDVAVISKGDGFIWIKRKHYFDRDKNPHFLANYYRDVQRGGSNGGSQSADKA